ncbi:MAG: GAF domain-containing protein [Saprospiraceae bacterium]
MSASAAMPYFIKPSVNLTSSEKEAAYQEAVTAIDATIDEETNMIVKMVTINCLLKSHLPYYYWVGFYVVDNGKLIVGPYQGTLGCLHIDFAKGVCGKAARERKTQIVGEVHALSQGTEHIACDPNSQSEIVLPVFDQDKNLIAVFDVDSSEKYSFDEIDKKYLEEILKRHFSENPITKIYVQ